MYLVNSVFYWSIFGILTSISRINGNLGKLGKKIIGISRRSMGFSGGRWDLAKVDGIWLRSMGFSETEWDFAEVDGI